MTDMTPADRKRLLANECNRRYRATANGRAKQRAALQRWRVSTGGRVKHLESDRKRNATPEGRAKKREYNLRVVGAKRVWAASPAGVAAQRRATTKRRTRAAGVLLCIQVTADHCGVCLKPLRPGLTWPDPMSTTIGHEPPLSVAEREGWLAVVERPEHWRCNQTKRDRTDLEMTFSFDADGATPEKEAIA